jgi:Fic family protein
MDTGLFERSPVGRLVPISVQDRWGDQVAHVAFVPDDLPHAVDFSARTYKILTDAALAIGRLDQAPARLPAHDYLIRLAVRLEARSTSALEGTFTRFTDVLESDYLDEGILSPQVREVRNYVTAAEWAFQRLGEEALSFDLLCRAQRRLVRGMPGQPQIALGLRMQQAYIGSPDRPVQEARFVPPPPGEPLLSGIAAWERWLHEDDDLPLIARVALAHYQFEALHPFADGNGRLGRLAAVLQLIQAGALRLPLLALSPWLEGRKEEYQRLLLDVSRVGDFDAWVRFFAEAVRDQADDAVRRIDRIASLGAAITDLLRDRGVRGLALAIAESLIGYPVISVRAAANLHQVTFQGANRAIGRLVNEGVLEEATGRRSDRLFVCQSIYKAVAA